MVDHPNILKLHKIHISKQFVFLVTDIATGGSLESYMNLRLKKGNHITDAECSDIIKQILSGLAYIHKLNVIHRDIGPKNILMRSKKDIRVLIADFGLGTKLADSDMLTASQKCGTAIYMAPEQLQGNNYTTVFYYEINIYYREWIFGRRVF